MGLIRIGISTLMITATLAPLNGQTGPNTLTPAQIALACAPPATAEPPPGNAVRVLGAQDTRPRTLLSPQDLLIVGGGTDNGLQLGQQFFVRRARRADGVYMRRVSGSTTAGWLRIVALNETTSIAVVDHACGAIFRNDYLEPFEAPSVPPDTDRNDSTGEPDFTSLARVVTAAENRVSAAPGDYVVIDRGADLGFEPGARVAIYRDVRATGMPLAALGEAVVMSTGRNTAVIRISRARDAVLVGDYLAPRK
jgi:hypothetical protein